MSSGNAPARAAPSGLEAARGPVDRKAERPRRSAAMGAVRDNDLDGLRKAIARRQLEEPGWQPSGDLDRQDQVQRAPRRAIGARSEGQWTESAKLADENGLIGGTSDVELLWVVAEALVHTERSLGSRGALRVRAREPHDSAERTATVQKALATLAHGGGREADRDGKAGPDGKSEFDAIRLDITRARISAFSAVIPRMRSRRPTSRRWRSLRVNRPSGQSGLLAWYAYRGGQFDAALDWFKLSLAHEGDAMTAHGLALTLLKLGLRRDAEEVAYAWREPLTNNMILFIDILETDLTREVPPSSNPRASPATRRSRRKRNPARELRHWHGTPTTPASSRPPTSGSSAPSPGFRRRRRSMVMSSRCSA